MFWLHNITIKSNSKFFTRFELQLDYTKVLAFLPAKNCKNIYYKLMDYDSISNLLTQNVTLNEVGGRPFIIFGYTKALPISNRVHKESLYL